MPDKCIRCLKYYKELTCFLSFFTILAKYIIMSSISTYPLDKISLQTIIKERSYRINNKFWLEYIATKKFSPTKTITKTNLKNVPSNKPGVYRIKNAQNDILYIGKAKGSRLPERIYEHKGEIEGGTRFQYKTTKTKESANRLEEQEIKKHNPPANKK